ncbi:hypothetical protein COCVIDRAFT_21519 [Bipolaris victoriae FI3]|uniref:Uncharacterized protein n=1 Tax=Bipolaris victoriae (strain FI3) TaxID=930091 RepID=W7EYA5_BIPV3|nr:hypothetical protein COCVIDRAFT_21519 [Bipolaris victoriae FI3]
MASHEIASGNDRKFNWDDDDDDDFDLDTWKATVDTSSPSVDELGPLQLSRCEESIESTTAYTSDRNSYRDAHSDTLASHVIDMTVDQSPDVDPEDGHASELEAVEAAPEAVYNNIIDTITEEEIASARHEYLTHAIGIYYDGKDEADAPAYPELSPYNGQRYRYAKAFQNVSHLTGRQRAQVYRHSPLAFVTGIEEAHLIGNRRRYENIHREEATESQNRDLYELPELQEPQPDFNFIYEEEKQQNTNEQVAPRRTPAQEHFSRDELKELIGMWKAQQERDGVDGSEEDEEAEDSSSIDTWEKSDEDEEETFGPLETELDDDDDNNIFSVVRPLEPRNSTHNEELDFNDVVFYAESECAIGDRDEGYVSSSPLISPVIGTCIDGCDWQAQHVEAQVRPKRAVRVDSMDALDTLATVEEYGASGDESCDEEDDAAEMLERRQDKTKMDIYHDSLFTTNHNEPVTTTISSFNKKGENSSTSAIETTIRKELSKDRSISHHTITPPTHPEQTKHHQQHQTLPDAYVSSVLTTSFLYISILTAGAVISSSMSAITPRDTQATKLD